MQFDYKLDNSGPRIVAGLKKNQKLQQGTLTVFDGNTQVGFTYYARGAMIDLEMPGGMTFKLELVNGEELSEHDQILVARLDTIGIIFLNFPKTLTSVDLTPAAEANKFNSDCGVFLAAFSQALSALTVEFDLDKPHRFAMAHNGSYGRNVFDFSVETLENFFSVLQGRIRSFPNSRLFKRAQELQESGHEVQAAHIAAPRKS